MNTLRPNSQAVQRASASLKKAATGYAVMLTVLFTFLIPLFMSIGEMILFDSTDFFEDIAVGFLVAFVFGAILGLLLRMFYNKNINAFCSAVSSCSVSITEDGNGIAGVALTAPVFNQNTVFGKQGAAHANIRLSFDQITGIETKPLSVGKTTLDQCFIIHFSGGSYQIPCVDEQDGLRFQTCIDERRHSAPHFSR